MNDRNIKMVIHLGANGFVLKRAEGGAPSAEPPDGGGGSRVAADGLLVLTVPLDLQAAHEGRGPGRRGADIC